MRILDADEQRLKSKGKLASRDIVQVGIWIQQQINTQITRNLIKVTMLY